MPDWWCYVPYPKHAWPKKNKIKTVSKRSKVLTVCCQSSGSLMTLDGNTSGLHCLKAPSRPPFSCRDRHRHQHQHQHQHQHHHPHTHHYHHHHHYHNHNHHHHHHHHYCHHHHLSHRNRQVLETGTEALFCNFGLSIHREVHITSHQQNMKIPYIMSHCVLLTCHKLEFHHKSVIQSKGYVFKSRNDSLSIVRKLWRHPTQGFHKVVRLPPCQAHVQNATFFQTIQQETFPKGNWSSNHSFSSAMLSWPPKFASLEPASARLRLAILQWRCGLRKPKEHFNQKIKVSRTC